MAGLDVEAMIKELVGSKVISAEEQNILISTYIEGNESNHFSPAGIALFLGSASYTEISRNNLELSLVVTTTLVTHVARIFVGEFEVSEEIKKAVDEIWQTILQAHLPVEGN